MADRTEIFSNRLGETAMAKRLTLVLGMVVLAAASMPSISESQEYVPSKDAVVENIS